MDMTPKQQRRQEHRDHGKYAKVNPCYFCGKSAGEDYGSHHCTDTGEWGDEGLCLCTKCCVFLESLPDDEALRRLKLSDYGGNPQKRKV